MAELVVVNVARDVLPAADGTTEYTLEPLPLSALAITLRASATGANTARAYADLAAMVTNIELLLAGTTLWQASTRDTMFLASCLSGADPYYRAQGVANNDLAELSVVVPLGRQLGSVRECLPQTPAGQLRLRLTQDIAVGALDTLRWDIDAIHLSDIMPEGFLRVQTLSRTAGATGDLDIDLPVGRRLVGIGLFETTVRVTEAGLSGINRVKILRDSIDTAYPSAEWSTLRAMTRQRLWSPDGLNEHTHRENVAAAYTQNVATEPQQTTGGVDYPYGYVDFDPGRDLALSLDLTTCNRAVLRLNMGVAEAMRALPVEWWPATAPGLAGGVRALGP